MVVYQTFRNADTTEGRGPMVPDLCFLHKKHAEEYIDTQPGIMGRRARWSTEKYGDWEVREVEVLDYSVIEEKKKKELIRQNALKKLKPEEIEALGILMNVVLK